MKNKWFFFGDYQGTRNTQGGSRLLTVPTAAARTGDLSAYGVNIYDPAGGDPARARSSPGNVIPAGRLSPQAPRAPRPDSAAERARARERDPRQLRGVRARRRSTAGLVQHPHRRPAERQVNIFGRYSCGDFFRDGPTAFGEGGGAGARQPRRRVATSRNHSLAFGVDYALSPTLLVDFRFGWFQYKVDVLPFDFGTTPAADAGIPGLNLDDDLHARACPRSSSKAATGRHRASARASDVEPLQLPARPEREAVADRREPHEAPGQPHRQVRHRHPPRLQPARAERRAPLGRADLQRATARAARRRRRLGLATFLLGDVTSFRRYVSPNTDARERQWRHFYYAQDTWRVNPKLTLNYGLRLDIINPQTVNEAGNGGWLDLDTGRDPGRRRRRRRPRRQRGEQRSTGRRASASPTRSTRRRCIRAGYGRSYDIGVFGSLFGHTVTQNLPVLSVQELNAPEQLRPRVQPRAAGRRRRSSPSPGRRPLPAAERRLRARAARASSGRRPSTPTTSPCSGSSRDTMSVEVGYVGNHGRSVFVGDGPDDQRQRADARRLPRTSRATSAGRSSPARPTAVLGLGGAFGWTQGIDYFCNCGQNCVQRAAGEAHPALLATATRSRRQLHAARRPTGTTTAATSSIDPDLNYGPAGLGSHAQLRALRCVAELPFGRDKRCGERLARRRRRAARRLAAQRQRHDPERPAVQTSATATPARIATSGRTGRTSSATPIGPETRDQWFNTHPDRDAGQRLRAAGAGHVRRPGAQRAARAGLLAGRRVALQDVRLGGQRELQLRIEVVNLFNHVNLGNPDSEVGVPGEPQRERRPHQLDRVRQLRPAAEPAVRLPLPVLASGLAARPQRRGAGRRLILRGGSAGPGGPAGRAGGGVWLGGAPPQRPPRPPLIRARCRPAGRESVLRSGSLPRSARSSPTAATPMPRTSLWWNGPAVLAAVAVWVSIAQAPRPRRRPRRAAAAAVPLHARRGTS